MNAEVLFLQVFFYYFPTGVYCSDPNLYLSILTRRQSSVSIPALP